MLRITGGTIFDPANGINGEVRDLCVDQGRFVESVDGGKTLDATGCVIFPGGIDVHTHVGGGAINFARAMTPEDHRRTQAFIASQTPGGSIIRSGLGGMAPTTFATGYLYAGMGFTMVNEAAVSVMAARHMHEELADIPIVDKSSLILMANNEILLDLIENGEFERGKQVIAWYLNAAKAYGIKAVNPGGVAAWKYGNDAKIMTETIPGYSTLTPGEVVTQMARMIDELGLPHPIHLHCNNLGAPGNITTTMESLKRLEGHRGHLAHLQYHAYGGDDWTTMKSEAVQVAEYFNAHKNLTCDAGAVLFGDTITVSADGPWQHLLYKLTGRKWGNLDIENETGCGIVPYNYNPSNLTNAVQWAVGLELMLLIDDPWRIYLSTDHPNGGCFWRYPEIIKLLMNRDFRAEQMSRCPANILSRVTLPEITREYSLYEIAIVMSAGPARALGIPRKGSLGVGADADIVIYNRVDDIEEMFSHPRYVLKAGEVVIDDGEIRETTMGSEFLIQPEVQTDTEDFMRPLFEDAYTMSFENYAVEMERIEHAEVQPCLPQNS